MESAIFGLVGVVIGSLGNLANELWIQHRKIRKEAEYLAIQLSCMLEKYVLGCASVVGDDGLCEGQPDENGYADSQVQIPQFEPESANVEWKSLPSSLMYDVLDFPNRAENANKKVKFAFEYDASPPMFEEGFQERQYQFAVLGIEASKLAKQLRDYVKLPTKPMADWDPIEFMENRKAEILGKRKIPST